MPTHQLRTPDAEKESIDDICLFAQTNFRKQMHKFGIRTDDRRRHMYVIGKTGMGKTTLMENMVLSDIYNGNGIGVVDPHGDFAEKIINYIPANRINDVVYMNPSDTNFPIGFNILEVSNKEQTHLVAAGLMGTFKKIWPDVWSSRMEYILNNTLIALLNCPGTTLLGINRLLSDKKYRKQVVGKLNDPVVKSFWNVEFANYEPRYQKEAVAPIQNKIGQFLSASVIRNMVAQVKSTINIREAMDNKKILIMNLSKGRIGEDNSRLLGGMLITKIQLAAMERVDTKEEDRKDFFLYVDEFQNFATPSFANILSEARKYRLSLIMAHQYIAQLDEVVADAVFGNVGTVTTFRVGGNDAETLVKEFTPTFIEEDIVNLPKFHILLKLMIDGVASQPFSAVTMPPIGSPTGSAEKVVKVSRERYGKRREEIEEKILRWSGMESGDVKDDGLTKKPTRSRVPSSKTEDKPNRPRLVFDSKPSVSDAEKKAYRTPKASTPVEKVEKSDHRTPKASTSVEKSNYRTPKVSVPEQKSVHITPKVNVSTEKKNYRTPKAAQSSLPSVKVNNDSTKKEQETKPKIEVKKFVEKSSSINNDSAMSLTSLPSRVEVVRDRGSSTSVPTSTDTSTDISNSQNSFDVGTVAPKLQEEISSSIPSSSSPDLVFSKEKKDVKDANDINLQNGDRPRKRRKRKRKRSPQGGDRAGGNVSKPPSSTI